MKVGKITPAFTMVWLAIVFLLSTLGVQVSAMGPHTYVGLYWPLANNYNFDVDFKITNAPQTNTGLFWAHQFTFDGGSGGYLGLQIVGLKHKAIFSIWGAIGGNPNKSGDTSAPETFNGCRAIDEGGPVWQCLIDYDWQIGTNYRLRLWVTTKESSGDQWWVAAVNNYATGQEKTIGSILTPKSYGWLGSWSTTWIEYFAYQTCDAPHTRAIFSYPYARNSEGDHAPLKAVVNYGNSGCADANIEYIGDGAYVIEAGNGVQRVTPDQTSLWTREPTLARQSASTTASSGDLSVNFDKPTYQQGDSVHISGNILTTGCTWDYTATNSGVAVSLAVYGPDGSLIHSKVTDPAAARYGSYAYDYVLPATAASGTYKVSVSSDNGPWLCGAGPITGQGTFTVLPGPAQQPPPSPPIKSNSIVTIVAGVIAIAALIAGLAFFSRLKRRTDRDQTEEETRVY